MTAEPAAVRCLQRTRSAVVNVMLAAGAGIAASGLLLSRRARGPLPQADRQLERLTQLVLIAIVAVSLVVRRTLGSRAALRDPDRRAERFFRAHLITALVGALAIPLSLAYGWFVQPELQAVLPFWVAALAMGVLAWPRAYELTDFDEPMSDPAEANQ